MAAPLPDAPFEGDLVRVVDYERRYLADVATLHKDDALTVGVLRGAARVTQRLEDVAFSAAEDGGPDGSGVALDRWGALAMRLRSGLPDGDYRRLILATIRAYRSQGDSDDLRDVGEAGTGTRPDLIPGAVTPSYTLVFPDTIPTAIIDALDPILMLAHPAGFGRGVALVPDGVFGTSPLPGLGAPLGSPAWVAGGGLVGTPGATQDVLVFPVVPAPGLAPEGSMDGVGPLGLGVPTREELRDDFRAEVEGCAGVVAWDDLPDDADLVAVETALLDAADVVRAEIQAAWLRTDPARANGVVLAVFLGSLLGVRRRLATFSTVPVRWTGTAILPVGTLFQTDGGLQFQLLEEATGPILPPVTVPARAVDPGPVQTGAFTITRTTDVILNVGTVSNPDPATPGLAEEDDEQYKLRFPSAVALSGKTTENAIRAAVLDLLRDDNRSPLVTNADVIVNNTDAGFTVDGVLTVDSHSVALVIAPDSLSTTEQESVARAVYGALASGIATNGSVVATVEYGGEVPQSRTIRLTLASALAIAVVVVTTPSRFASPADVIAEVEDRTRTFFANLRTGEDVEFQALDCFLVKTSGLLSHTLTLDGGTSDITVDVDEVGTIGSLTVT